jgi:hypothetical protein
MHHAIADLYPGAHRKGMGRPMSGRGGKAFPSADPFAGDQMLDRQMVSFPSGQKKKSSTITRRPSVSASAT